MKAKPMLGADVAAHLRTQVAANTKGAGVPGLAAIVIGHDEASELYLRNKRRMCQELGFSFELFHLPETESRGDLIGLIHELNRESRLHGIFLQLPLPEALEAAKYELFDAIDPTKDVDALSAANAIELYRGKLGLFIPATVRAVLEMMRYYGITTKGKRILVVGRNDITGKPLALILGGRAGAEFGKDLGNAEVIWANQYTPDNNLREDASRADIVISCAGVDPAYLGRRYLIPAEWLKPGVAVFDVATRMSGSGLVGDVDVEGATDRAAYVAPVPGGVGPMTVMSLMQNLVDAERYAAGMAKATYDYGPAGAGISS